MEHAIRIERHGGADVLHWTAVDVPPPGPGEVRLRTGAAGVNFIDTYHRTGLYPVPLPSGLGLESAGTVEAVGEGVTGFAPGDRVATFGPALGAYATARNVPAAGLFALPAAIDDATAAAMLLKGLTAEFLAERCARVQPGWTVLVHAAAGGVGQILTAWLKALGAQVIGTVGSAAKAAAARDAGADHVILYREEDIATRVRAITGGEGVPVVFDGTGRDSWQASLASAARRGLIVSFGNASGPVDAVNLAVLNAHGSLFVTRPKLFDYYVTPHERAACAARLWSMVESGAIRPNIGLRLPLADAAEAHRRMEAGETQGATVLLP